MKQKILTLFMAGTATFLACSLIAFPGQAFEASIRGLNMWSEIVFPSLLPFFITAELLIAFGVVKFLGILFEPIMRPLFNVPGAGSFGWIMGMASGYPTGAKIAVRLREENQLTRLEAERLVSFTNASSPLFIFGAVSIGFFHDAKLGILLAASHYTGNALVGICMRFHGSRKGKNDKTPPLMYGNGTGRFPVVQALRAMHRTRLRDKKPLGEIASTAVINSIKTLVMVGGFIILFSVLTKLLFLIGASPLAAEAIEWLLAALGLPPGLAQPLFTGMFEITLGAQMISQFPAQMFGKAMVISFILGFNGFSIQSQVASILAKSDIRFSPYFFARLLHGTFAAMLTAVLYKPLYVDRQVFDYQDLPVIHHESGFSISELLPYLKTAGPLLTISFLGFAVILLLLRRPAGESK